MPASATDSPDCRGTADFVSRRDAVSTVSLPKASIAARNRGLRAVERGRRHQELGDIGLELGVGGAVFGVAETAEQHRAVVDGDLPAAQVAVRDLVRRAGFAAIPTPRATGIASAHSLIGVPRGGLVRVQASSPGRARRRPSSTCWRHRDRRWRSPSARDARRRGAWRRAGARSRCRAAVSFRQSWRSAPPLR